MLTLRFGWLDLLSESVRMDLDKWPRIFFYLYQLEKEIFFFTKNEKMLAIYGFHSEHILKSFFFFIKGGFFSESAIHFSNLKKKIFRKTILNLKFKFQAQDSFLEYFFSEIWKANRTFWIKATISKFRKKVPSKIN